MEKHTHTFTVQSNRTPFLFRLWYLITNPFLYLIKGKVIL